ncbi:MAG: hypothetical protein ACTS4U_01800, partial [Candidatus Hodgkinia cicadicola]
MWVLVSWFFNKSLRKLNERKFWKVGDLLKTELNLMELCFESLGMFKRKNKLNLNGQFYSTIELYESLNMNGS